MNAKMVLGQEFPCIGLGTFPMRGEDLRCAVKSALFSGYRLFDTAFKYGNESEIAHCLKSFPSSERVFVQTKISVTQLSDKRILGIRYGHHTAKDALRDSLKRLGKKKLDVYLVHSPANGYESLYSSLMGFREEGLVSVIGVCGFQEDHLRKINDKFGEYPAINQIEVHPYYSNRRLVDFCKEKGVTVEARSPFAHGDVMEEFILNPVLSSIASEYGKTVPQIIIKWLIQQGLIVIAKSENPTHISENIGIGGFEMAEFEMKAINGLNQDLSFGFVGKQRR